MSVTQRLMKPGSFSISLQPGFLQSITSRIARFDHIVITPTPLDPIEGFSDADILGQAIYTGVIRKMPSPRTLEGADLSAWLGTEDGLGDNFGAAVEQTQTMSAWVSSILTAAGNGITAGTLTNTGLSSLTGAPSWCSPREAIDWVMRGAGAEYRMQPDGTLDAAKAPDLFVSTPTTVVTRYEEGQDGPYRGLEGELISTAADVEQYTTEVQVIGTGQGVSVVVETATGSTTFKTFTNTTPVFRRFVNAPSEVAAAGAVASMQLGLWNQERTEVALTSRTYNVTRFVAAGDYVWVYDPAAGLVDPAEQIDYRGGVISPVKMRVHALTWPVHSGLGVYLRKSGATPTYIDLTPFVEWEQGEVRWDVGAAPRASNDVDAKLAGTTAYLGANAAVAERASTAGAVLSYTPALTATTTNPNIGSTAIAEGEYQVVNGRCSGRGTIYANGAGITSGTGLYRVSLPYPARLLPSTSVVAVGHGSVYLGNPGPTVNPVTLDVSPGASTARLIGPGFEAGSTTGGGGIGLAGNAIWFQFDYPIA